MNKKIISSFLALILVFTIFSGTIYAADDSIGVDIYEEVTEDDSTGDDIYEEVTEDNTVCETEEAADETEEAADETESGYIAGAEAETFDYSADNATIIMSKKADLNLYFYSVSGDKKFEVSNKKLASVNKKGILTVKKAGMLDVTCLKKEDGKWVNAATMTFDIKVPKAAMKTIPAGTLYKEGQSIHLRGYIIDNDGIEPSHWSAKANPEVAVLNNETGELTAGSKNGTVVVYAEYCCLRTDGYGKDPLARTIKFTVKIDHKKIALDKEYSTPQVMKMRYTVSNKKIATINKKGILSFKKEGSVTVNIQIKEGKNWIYTGTKAVSYTLRNNSGKYDIQEGIAERELAEGGSYTTKEDVSYYIYHYDCLPQNFITKKEAQALGWPGGGLDPYADGKCIGGDYYSNYEGTLPEGDYRECDIDTLHKKSRGAKRLVYDLSDGDIYYTADHYKTFIQLY